MFMGLEAGVGFGRNSSHILATLRLSLCLGIPMEYFAKVWMNIVIGYMEQSKIARIKILYWLGIH